MQRPDVESLTMTTTRTIAQPTARPGAGEHAPYYGAYVDLVPDGDIVAQLKSQRESVVAFLRTIPESRSTILHPPYTWTIRQVVGHLTDGERIFGYRALRIARGDTTALPGFDENEYARAPEFANVDLARLVDEFDAVRASTIALYENLAPESWSRRGHANGQPVSVRALAYITVGHTIHHANIVRKRLESPRLQPA
jgi:hypothetical protein